jgi:type II secretory pathway pseudopilin PulG
MKYLKNQQLINSDSGFTIVEILVIVLIIGILSTVLVLTYSGVEVRQQNTSRITAIKLIQSNLETFYAQSGFYPTLSEMNSATWTKANLKSLQASDLRDPDSKSNSPNFADMPTVNIYSYQPTASDGKSKCDDRTTACAQYVLTATLGGNSGTFIEKSLN